MQLLATGREGHRRLPAGSRQLLVVIPAAACLPSRVTTAHPSSLLYIKNSNVWQSSPGWCVQRQISTDGVADDGYGTPSETDSGVIVAAHDRPSVSPGSFYSHKPGGSRWHGETSRSTI